MKSIEREAYYFAGIAIVAAKFGIDIKRLAINEKKRWNGEASLAPIKSRVLDAGLDYDRVMQVEDYATALLAGSAACFVREQERRSSLTRSLGSEGLEMKYLRAVRSGQRRELDRAIAIICGALGAYDEGDIEATAKRLWARAARMLKHPKHLGQLKLVVRELTQKKELTSEEVLQLLS